MILLISFAAAAVLGFFFQNMFSRRQAFTLLSEYIDDIEGEWDLDAVIKTYVMDFFDDEVLSNRETYLQNDKLEGLITANQGYVAELTVVDRDGIVAASSNPDMIGRQFFSDEYTSSFRCLFEGEDYYAPSFDPNPFTKEGAPEILYAGRPFYDGQGIILLGVDEDTRAMHVSLDRFTDAYNSRIGMTGYVITCYPDKNINGISYISDIETEVPFEKPELLPEKDGETKNSVTELYGKESYVSALKQPDYYLITVYPSDEADDLKEKNNSLFVGMILLVFTSLFIVLIAFINNHIISQVKSIHGSLKKITDGDLNERASAGGSVEFYGLSDNINGTVEKLEDMIRQAKDQMAEELMNAKRIQESAVPQKFPEHEAFGIYASMNTAESVGGDFYDFFMCSDDTLAFVMADVSGKGMPAALYMMRAKTLIRTYAMQGLPVEEVAARTNVKLCEDAAKDMFVTAWIGFLNLNTGVISYVHAGHTYPVLVRKDSVDFVKQKVNMVLGGLKRVKYVRQEVTLLPGDCLYLYTDGVSEAKDVSGDMYGEERLLHLISEKLKDISASDNNGFCKAAGGLVYDDVQHFTEGAEQYDDITMMWVRFGHVDTGSL